MQIFIYTLSHPITNEVKYVGKTVNPKQRKHNHSNSARDKGTYKRNWINYLKAQNLRPKFEIIDIIEEDWKFWERYWILQLKTWGYKLCNHTEGGDGLSMANQTSFKKGQTPWNLGKPASNYVIEAARQFNLGRKSTPETLLKKSRSMKLVVRSSNHIEALVIGGQATRFKVGLEVWNKGKSGYKLSGRKTSTPVIQYDLDGNIIAEFLGCKEAAEAVGCIPESIRLVCVGKNKVAKKFIWKYKIKNHE